MTAGLLSQWVLGRGVDAQSGRLVQPAGLELPLLNPQLRRDLRIVTAHRLDEPLGDLASDEDLERDTEREIERESFVDDGVDDHERTP